jgi:transcriptional regulator with XRE-family HTH domain
MLGWSQDDLAVRAGISRETVSRLERGATPHLRTARAVAAALGVDAALLWPVNDEGRAGQLAPATTSAGGDGRDVSG